MSKMRRLGVVCLLLIARSVTAAPPPPAQVTGPSPANQAASVPTTSLLSWAAPSRAQRYDVFVGTALPLARVAADQTATSYQPSALSSGTTYFWRIDAKNQSGTTTGAVWSFTTAAAPAPPGPPANPSPADGATSVGPASTILSWNAPSGAATYDVAFGASSPPPVVA